MKTDTIKEARWIWRGQQVPIPHQAINFRKVFSLSNIPAKAEVQIAVDSDFVLFVNGKEAGRFQFSDYPRDRTFSRIDVRPYLQKGGNLLAVWAYHRGEDFSDHRAGRAGMIAALCMGGTVLRTDNTWRTRQDPAFRAGSMPRVTVQMGFTTCYDARKADDWVNPGYDDSAWSAAVELAGAEDGYWQRLNPRPVPPITLGLDVPVLVCQQGLFIRRRQGASFAQTMAGDGLISLFPHTAFANGASLYSSGGYAGVPANPGTLLGGPDAEGLILEPPPTGHQGRYLVTDLGREEVGLLHVRLEAPTGTVLDLGHGEHLEDGRIRTHVGGRNFADRYICREGVNDFLLPFRRLGCRYIALHVSRFMRPVRVQYVGLRPTRYPLDIKGCFSCNDTLENRIDQIGTRTLELCMHEHYEDSPWREQSLYAYDGRNQALFGYHAFGNYDFAAASLDLLGKGLRADGLLSLTAPGRENHRTIPIFSFAWMCALHDYYLYSGDLSLFGKYAGQIKVMLDKILKRYDPKNGLFHLPEGEFIWHYYEWTRGLAGEGPQINRHHDHHAAYNLHLHEALGAAASLYAAHADGSQSSILLKARRLLGRAIHRVFWSPERQCYTTEVRRGNTHGEHELVQALALHQNIPGSRQTSCLVKTLQKEVLPACTLSALPYLIEALMPLTPETRRLAASRIARLWQTMALQGATSFWETIEGAADFDHAGSLCHGWSALPVYFHHACILGVTPLEPGFRRFRFAPWAGRLYQAEGTVPTPQGSIHVRWEKTPEGLRVELKHPDRCIPVILPFSECPIRELNRRVNRGTSKTRKNA